MGLGGWRGGSQDVCLPMSRDSERKRREEWDERRVTGEEGRESISIQRRYHVLTESLRLNCWLTYSQSNLQQSTFCMYVYLIEISWLQF